MRFSRSVLLLAANYCRAYMRNKIKLLKMCTIVLRFGLIHICSSDSRVSSSACDSIEHDSDHDTWMLDKTDRSVLFYETEFAFIRQ